MKIVKFLTSSSIATAVDFLLYSGLIYLLSPVVSQAISASVGMVINFVLQRNWVFTPTRGLKVSFFLSLLFSTIGVGLGSLIIFILTNYTILTGFPIAAKIVTVGIIFIYNYFTKKIAFGDTKR